MASSREIILWLDERWYKALSQQLGEDAVEARLNQYMEQLIQQLPQDQREKISGEIQREDRLWQERLEAERHFSIYRVKERGKESCFQLENTPASLLNTAYDIRRYLRQEPGWKADSYADLFPKWEPITAEKFDQMAELHMENPRKVTDVFDLDFDKQEFSAADPQEGWQTYSMKDKSTAAYYAFRSGNASYKQRCERLMNNLRGKEITSAGHLSLREISLADEICEMDGQRLNFYIETSFDVDAVFGTHICTAENDDTLPGEMTAAAFHCTPQQMGQMAEEGGLMCFYTPADVEELSPLAVCSVRENGKALARHTMYFGSFDPETALRSAQRYAHDRQISVTDALLSLTADMELDSGGGARKLLVSGDEDMTPLIASCFDHYPALAAFLTFDADRDLVEVEYNPLWLDLRQRQEPAQSKLELM